MHLNLIKICLQCFIFLAIVAINTLLESFGGYLGLDLSNETAAGYDLLAAFHRAAAICSSGVGASCGPIFESAIGLFAPPPLARDRRLISTFLDAETPAEAASSDSGRGFAADASERLDSLGALEEYDKAAQIMVDKNDELLESLKAVSPEAGAAPRLTNGQRRLLLGDKHEESSVTAASHRSSESPLVNRDGTSFPREILHKSPLSLSMSDEDLLKVNAQGMNFLDEALLLDQSAAEIVPILEGSTVSSQSGDLLRKLAIPSGPIVHAVAFPETERSGHHILGHRSASVADDCVHPRLYELKADTRGRQVKPPSLTGKSSSIIQDTTSSTEHQPSDNLRATREAIPLFDVRRSPILSPTPSYPPPIIAMSIKILASPGTPKSGSAIDALQIGTPSSSAMRGLFTPILDYDAEISSPIVTGFNATIMRKGMGLALSPDASDGVSVPNTPSEEYLAWTTSTLTSRSTETSGPVAFSTPFATNTPQQPGTEDTTTELSLPDLGDLQWMNFQLHNFNQESVSKLNALAIETLDLGYLGSLPLSTSEERQFAELLLSTPLKDLIEQNIFSLSESYQWLEQYIPPGAVLASQPDPSGLDALLADYGFMQYTQGKSGPISPGRGSTYVYLIDATTAFHQSPQIAMGSSVPFSMGLKSPQAMEADSLISLVQLRGTEASLDSVVGDTAERYREPLTIKLPSPSDGDFPIRSISTRSSPPMDSLPVTPLDGPAGDAILVATAPSTDVVPPSGGNGETSHPPMVAQDPAREMLHDLNDLSGLDTPIQSKKGGFPTTVETITTGDVAEIGKFCTKKLFGVPRSVRRERKVGADDTRANVSVGASPCECVADVGEDADHDARVLCSSCQTQSMLVVS